MSGRSAADLVKDRVQAAAQALQTASPLPYVGRLIDESFSLPSDDEKYGANNLTPGAIPFEPSYSEQDPHALRFTIEPLGPGSSPVARRDEATREMRRLVGPVFGKDALRWFDERSEDWRGFTAGGRIAYGAWFGTAYDRDGLSSSKVYYELLPSQIEALPGPLARLVRLAATTMPSLVPVFTSIGCRRGRGNQRVTFLHRGQLRLTDLGPLLNRLNLGHQLPSLMQIVGLALGGRFDLPERSVLLGISDAADGAEVKLEILLGMLPDLPPSFLNLVALGLSERPRELHALNRWLRAFTPDSYDRPGEFSVLSIRATPRTPARVSVYLRPVEFELTRHFAESSRSRPPNNAAVA